MFGLLPLSVSLSLGGIAHAQAPASATLVAELTTQATPAAGDRFGHSVALGADAAFVGAKNEADTASSSGVVYRFDDTGAYVQSYADPDGAGTVFGEALSMAGDLLVIGDSVRFQVHLFDPDTGNRSDLISDPDLTSGDFFGTDVDGDADGVLVGSWRVVPGEVHLFDPADGSLLVRIEDGAPVSGDRFGQTVALGTDFIAVGEPYNDDVGTNAGAVHIYERSDGTHRMTLYDSDPSDPGILGWTVAADGDQVIGCSPNDARWNPSGDAAHGNGACFVWNATTGALVSTIGATATHSVNSLGERAVEIDGALIAVTGTDRVDLYDASTGDHLLQIDDPSGTTNNKFGHGVDLDGTRLLVGAPQNDTGASDAGVAYLFELAGVGIEDSDGDGVPDDEDVCEGDDAAGDPDGDGFCSDLDNCPSDANADQADADADEIGDACEGDTDADGVIDDHDLCPDDWDPTQDDTDGDGAGDACDLDDDNDGVVDTSDNCPLVGNAGQADTDGDGQGDACDNDDDGDGVDDSTDAYPASPGEAPIGSDGCTGEQAIVLECGTSDDHPNHGAYVSCVAQSSRDARDAGLLTSKERAAIVRRAAKSN